MELFKISDGPWETLFDGSFQREHEVAVYSNDKSTILVLIFEKHGKTVDGAVAELYKVFYATGELESFVESLPRELLLLTKHNEKETLKFLLLGSGPTYIEWKEEQVIQEIDRLLTKIDTSSQILADVTKAYDISVEELYKAKAGVKKSFFSMPLLIPILSTNYHSEEKLAADVPVSFHEFIVGLTRQKSKVVEPITLFSKTLVMNGSKEERHHALQLLTEGYLLSGAPVVVFDLENNFKGLKFPTTKIDELKRYEIESEPIGFPVRVFLPVTDIKIDMNKTDPFGFAEVFGFAKSKSVEILAASIMKSNISGINELIRKIKGLSGSEFSEYEVNRTIRILLLIGKSHPNLFEGTNSVEEIATRKVKSLGRGSILDLSGIDEKTRMVLAHNILSQLLEYFKGKEKQQGLKTVVVIPDAKVLLDEKISPSLSKDISSILTQFEKNGVGYVLSNESELDFPQTIVQNSEAQISFIQQNDCAVQLKGRKGYRVLLRPTLSSNDAQMQSVQAKTA